MTAIQKTTGSACILANQWIFTPADQIVQKLDGESVSLRKKMPMCCRFWFTQTVTPE